MLKAIYNGVTHDHLQPKARFLTLRVLANEINLIWRKITFTWYFASEI